MKIKIFTILLMGSISLIAPTNLFAQITDVATEISSDESDRRISLDLKGMDVVEVLKTLASKGKMNIVVGSKVTGRITMFLNNVDVEDAFEMILLASNLARDKKGDIIYIMTESEYEQLYGEKYGDKKEAKIFQLKYAKAPEVSKALNLIKTKIGKVIADDVSNTLVVIDAPQALSQAADLIERIDKPTSTRTFELSYASCKDVKDKIQDMLTKGVGTIQIDERTNKIVVTDLEEKLSSIENVISAFDDKLQQVLIDSKIVEITLDDKYKLGVDWQNVFKRMNKDINIKSAFKLATSGTLIPGAELIIGDVGSTDYDLLVQALKEVGDVNTLSCPRITALNNQEAKILVGTNQPYATNTVTQGTSTTTTATALTFIDIGVKLYVTPTINRDGFVTVKIRPEVSSQSGTYTYGSPSTTVPVVSTTNAETSIMVKDGATIIIAGLIKDERTNTLDTIPVLGDIPLIGMAFSKTDKETKKKELVIFITPHIISGEVDYLKVPDTPPMGKGLFTLPEKPDFDKRRPVKISPSYIKETPVSRKKKDLKPGPLTETPEEYFYNIRERILSNMAISRKALHLSRGDRVKISFALFSGGNLASKPEVLESTNSYLSNMLVEAVENSAPFPIFPLSIKEPMKNFTLDILYQPD